MNSLVYQYQLLNTMWTAHTGSTLKQSMNALLNDESGQGITEYGAVLGFVVILIGALCTLMIGSGADGYGVIIQMFNRVAQGVSMIWGPGFGNLLGSMSGALFSSR